LTSTQPNGLLNGDLEEVRTAAMGQGPGALRISVINDPPGIAVEGDVDIVTVKAFDEAVAAALTESPGDVQINLSGVGFIDLDGLRILVKASRTMAAEGRKLVLVNLAPHLQEVLRIVGWSEELAVTEKGEDGGAE
jgi:anti-anti-sigma factor